MTYETKKNVPFFYKKRKRTQISERSFEKNGCPTLEKPDKLSGGNPFNLQDYCPKVGQKIKHLKSTHPSVRWADLFQMCVWHMTTDQD